MESLSTIEKVVEATVEKKLFEIIPREMKYPLPLVEYFIITGKKIRIHLEIYDDTVIAYLADDKDIFAEGDTIKKAKMNLRKSLLDEYEFLSRHKNELSDEFTGKLNNMRSIIEWSLRY